MNARLILKEAPPPPRGKAGYRHRYSYQEAAAELRANPGRWAIIATFDDRKPTRDRNRSTGNVQARNLAKNLKNGLLASFRPAGSFDAVTRLSDEGYQVWASYRAEQA
jgi:hypothetical protein